MRDRAELPIPVIALCLLISSACGSSTAQPVPTVAPPATSTTAPVATATLVPFPPPLPENPADASTDLYFIYEWVEDRKPHYDQVLNGVLVGPTVIPSWCPPGIKGTHLPLEALDGTVLEFTPGYLPEDASESTSDSSAWGCGEDLLKVERHFGQPGNAVRHGGFIGIHRTLTDKPAVEVERPAERMKEGEIAGLPAVIVEPMLPEPYQHWTNVTVIVWDAPAGLLTVVETVGFTLDETIRIAEGLFPSD